MSLLTRRNLVVVFTAVFVPLLAATVLTQTPALTWVKAAPFPEPDEELYGIAAGGKMYVLGGYGFQGVPRGIVYEYDATTDKWTKKKNMPTPVHHQAMVEYKGKIYLFGGFKAPTAPEAPGGWEPIDASWEYDPAADTWKALPPLPIKRGSAIAFEVGGKFYVIGGAGPHPNSKETVLRGSGPARSLDLNDVFDPASGKWEARQPMPTSRNHAFGGVVNGKIYVIGGRLGHGFIGVATNTDIVEEYDPAIDSWGGLKDRMPTPRSGGGWATYGGKIYVVGGEVATPALAGAFRAVEAYDPAANNWSTVPPMPMPRHGVATAFLGNKLHLVSGMITTAAAAAGQDPKMEVHTSSHDVLELSNGASK